MRRGIDGAQHGSALAILVESVHDYGAVEEKIDCRNYEDPDAQPFQHPQVLWNISVQSWLTSVRFRIAAHGISFEGHTDRTCSSSKILADTHVIT